MVNSERGQAIKNWLEEEDLSFVWLIKRLVEYGFVVEKSELSSMFSGRRAMSMPI